MNLLSKLIPNEDLQKQVIKEFKISLFEENLKEYLKQYDRLFNELKAIQETAEKVPQYQKMNIVLTIQRKNNELQLCRFAIEKLENEIETIKKNS